MRDDYKPAELQRQSAKAEIELAGLQWNIIGAANANLTAKLINSPSCDIAAPQPKKPKP